MTGNDRPYLAYLDSLRGIAALVIAMFWHYQHFSRSFQPGYPLFTTSPLYDWPLIHLFYTRGYLSVDFFFMISGVVFGHVYEAAIAERRIGLVDFAWLRFARLYPLHLLTLLLAGGLAWSFHAYTGRFPVYEANDLKHFVGSLFLLQTVPFPIGGFSFNAPSWSLSTEAMMYGLFFLVAVAGRARECAPLLVVFGVIGWLIGAEVSWMRGLVGFFGGLWIQHLSARRPLLRLIPPALFCGVLLLDQFDAIPRAAGVHRELAASWATSAIVLSLAGTWRLLRQVLELPWLRTLGDLSLGIYLLNIPVQFAVLLLLAVLKLVPPADSLAFWTALTLLQLACAWVMHVRFERPCRVWLRSLATRRNAAAAKARAGSA